MTNIITGHRGFIGGKMHERMMNDNSEFIAYDIRDPGPYPYNMPVLEQIDIENIFLVGAVAGIEDCETEMEWAFEHNVESVQKWAHVALEKEARIIFTSSMAAGSVKPTWYGITKRLAEKILMYYHKVHNLPVTILRLPNVYGPGSFKKNSVVARMCKDAILNKHIFVHGNGQQTRNFIHVDDVVNALMTVRRDGIYRISNGRIFTIQGLATEIKEHFPDARIEHTQTKDSFGIVPHDQVKDLAISITKPFQEGLKETAEYFKKPWDRNSDPLGGEKK